VLWYFHRRFWCQSDDGNYGHIAERVLRGEVLHRDVQDIHPGYIDLVNAAALRLFGVDLVSLRYPLAAAALVQSALVFLLLRRRPFLALAASLATVALGVIQFLDPTAHWYCLLLAVAIAGALRWLPPGRTRLIVTGFLLGLLAMFRQLSGVITGLGLLTYLILEAHEDARGREVLLERVLLAVMGAGLTGYLLSATNLAGWLLFGVWPLLLLAWMGKTAAAPNARVAGLIAGLGAGALLAVAPLALYHVAHGSVRAWLDDVLGAPFALGRLPFMRLSLYGWLAASGVVQLCSGSVRGTLNGLYWCLLPLLAAANGALVLRALVRGERPALPVLSVFYAVISVHYQIPIYLHYTLALTAVSLLTLAATWGHRARATVVGLAAAVTFVAIYFHGGQPLIRGFEGIATGQRVPLVPAGLPRASLWIDAGDRERYRQLVGLIERETRRDDAIFALPGGAELYFLTGRRNPFRFFNTAFGLRGEDDLRQAERLLVERPPRLVIHDPTDKYGNPQSARLMQTIRSRYTLLRTIGALEIYRPR
jgi:hypothetical protein